MLQINPRYAATDENLQPGARVLFNENGRPYPGTINAIEGKIFIIRSEGTTLVARVTRSEILAIRLRSHEEHSARTRERGKYGRSSKVTYAHITHKIYGDHDDACEFCVKEAGRSEAQRERQERRQNGQYEEYSECEYADCAHRSRKLAHSAATVIPADGEEPGNGIVEMHYDCARAYLQMINSTYSI